MIIGVDTGCLSVESCKLKVGVYQFSLNLLRKLTLLDKQNQYLLYSFSPVDRKILKEIGGNVANPVLRPKRGWMSLRLSLEFLLKPPDIFLGLSQALPFYHPRKSIVFVHDLAFEYYPDCYKESYRRLSRQTKYAVKNADKIIAVSESTKNDLVKLYGINAEKIEVIYHGVEPVFTPQSKKVIERIRKKYKLDSPYFLFVGSFKSIKNIPRIIFAFALFLKQTKKQYCLVLVGSDYWFEREIQKTINQLELEDKVKILGFLPDEDLSGIYSGASVFVSPSLYEGFGLPHLEAMACGIPVVASDLSSMPEIIGKAGLLVDPMNKEKISRALFQVATDISLQRQLKEKARLQAKRFSWEKSAKKLLKLYE